ncbi:MAG: serine hydrolase [Saprospiraceae bacterium]|nr:serine hydrolase [Saprospiraceae bacterium]
MRILRGNKGLSASIIFSDGSHWSSTSGVSSSILNLDTSMIFSIGSITKTITSAAILKYTENQKLQLDDPIGEHIDSIKFVNSTITIRQLLRHQSGIFDILTNPQFNVFMNNYPDSIWLARNALTTFLQKPNFAPGTAFQYSNSNYVILGMILEKISGKPYADVIEELFQTQAQFPSFTIRPYRDYGIPIANVWLDYTGDNIVDDAEDYIFNWKAFSSIVAPAGCIFSNAYDITNWIKQFCGDKLISEAIMNEAKTTISAGLPNNTSYGLGLMKRKLAGFDAYGHGGDIGYSAFSWYLPEKNVSISILNNDGSKTSWTLNPVIEELLKTYFNFVASSLTDFSSQEYTLIYPNPTSDILNISLPKINTDYKIKIYSSTGKLLFNTDLDQGIITHLDVNELHAGIYFIEFISSGKLSFRKTFIKL